MKHIDEIQGFSRDILFSPEGRYTTSWGTALSNCVLEVVERDVQGRCPVLSLRFYHQPEPLEYDAETPVGVEINLGPELTRSFVEQLQTQLPGYQRMLQAASDEDAPDPD